MVQTYADSTPHELSDDVQADHHRVDHDILYKMNELLEACFNFGLSKVGENDEIYAYREEAYLQVQSYKRELMFLKMMTWTWDDIDAKLRGVLDDLEVIRQYLGGLIDGEASLLGKRNFDLYASLLEDTIKQCKPFIVDYCHVLLDSSGAKGCTPTPRPPTVQPHELLLDSSLQCKSLASDKTIQFVEDILHNLEVLVRYKIDVDAVSTVKLQIDSIKLRVKLSRDFFRLIATHGDMKCEELRELEVCLRSFANNAAPLVFLFWALPENEEITLATKINQLVSDMWEKICKPRCPDVKPMWLKALHAIKLEPFNDAILLGEVVGGFVDLLLDNLVAASKDDWRIREGMIFLLTFMSNPPKGCDHDEQLVLLCDQIELLFRKCMQQHFTMEMIVLDDLSQNLEEMMGTVKQLYVQIPDYLSFNFPRTNGLGFYDFLIQKLETWKENLKSDATSIPFAKNFIIKIQEELVSLRPLVNGIFELQKEKNEFEDTWSRVINLAYRIEHVINSCTIRSHSIWYNMSCLYDILDQIGKVKRKLQSMGNCNMLYTKVLSRSLESSNVTSERTWFSTTSEEEIIGLKDKTRMIIDQLIGGYESLGIVSIIGMGGLGKTTLAKEIYNSKTVRCHFHKLGFGCVSQVLHRRKFFVDILYSIGYCKKEEIESMTEDDLAHHLWRCLSGQTYLIVIDDIWDIKAWDAIKSSLPDDKNKSRVIFTTRELKVGLDAKSSLHDLQPLSDDESSKLLHIKVFRKNDCPPDFSEFGKMILKTCKGLPLAILVVAGLLARNKTSSSWWKKIAEASSQFIGQECEEIIGYSYTYLPEHLKSCFLYMAIYEEDELIEAKRLRQLWIGEGFVNKSMTKSLRIVAKEYLKDLADRNLVTVVGRSSGGEIRTCRLHDVIGDFCRRQAKKEDFLWQGDGYASTTSSDPTIRNMYRISMQGSFDDVKPPVVENTHSLLCRRTMTLRKFLSEELKLVQVLHLEGETEFVFSGHLVLLRYISISRWDQEVPESICNLWNLETFIVKYCKSCLKLPKTIWKMKRLRHLEFGGGCYLDVDGYEYEGGYQVSNNIQFLSELLLLSERSAKAVLLRLPNIQKLICKLAMDFKDFRIDFLGKLESLRLWSTVGTLISFRFPSTLKRLYLLVEESLTQHTLSAIGELPCLEILKLSGKSERWDVKDGQFRKMKCLKVGLCILEQWNVSFESFSCLQQLELSSCQRLEEIPACFAELPTLQRIRVHWCNKELESSAIQVQREQTDNGNKVRLEIVEGVFLNSPLLELRYGKK